MLNAAVEIGHQHTALKKSNVQINFSDIWFDIQSGNEEFFIEITEPSAYAGTWGPFRADAMAGGPINVVPPQVVGDGGSPEAFVASTGVWAGLSVHGPITLSGDWVDGYGAEIALGDSYAGRAEDAIYGLKRRERAENAGPEIGYAEAIAVPRRFPNLTRINTSRAFRIESHGEIVTRKVGFVAMIDIEAVGATGDIFRAVSNTGFVLRVNPASELEVAVNDNTGATVDTLTLPDFVIDGAQGPLAIAIDVDFDRPDPEPTIWFCAASGARRATPVTSSANRGGFTRWPDKNWLFPYAYAIQPVTVHEWFALYVDAMPSIRDAWATAFFDLAAMTPKAIFGADGLPEGIAPYVAKTGPARDWITPTNFGSGPDFTDPTDSDIEDAS